MSQEKMLKEKNKFTYIQRLFSETNWIYYFAKEKNEYPLVLNQDPTEFIGKGEGKETHLSQIVSNVAIEYPLKTFQIYCLFVVDFDYSIENMVDVEKGKELLNKMITAMNFSEYEYLICSTDESHNMIFKKRPQFVITMGAKPTHFFLEKDTRLTQTHGKFFKREFQEGESIVTTNIMPVFHPQYLLINPNMKRIQWNDLKKVMKQ